MLRVGIVGCGRISNLHELGYRNSPNAKIVAVCDKNKKMANDKARQWNAEKVYYDYNQMLQSDDIDIVELIVPHHLHCSMSIDACKAGKHVSVQKPMALNLQEADQMIEAALKANTYLRVYENFVFYPPIVKAKQLIDSDEIGSPQMLRVHFNCGSFEKAWKVPLSAWLWRLDEKKCGGGPLVFDHGYHLFSVAHYLMGPVERVSAWIDSHQIVPTKKVDGPATIMLKFKESRRYGTIDFAYTPQMLINSPYYSDDNRIEIVGEKGIIKINRCTTKTFDLPVLMMFKDGKTTEIPICRTEWEESFIDCTKHFISAIENGTKPSLDCFTARDVLQTAIAAQVSARERREIDTDEMDQFT